MSDHEKMSPAEREVSELLGKLEIWHKFEHPVAVYEENNRLRIWYPDFFLPLLGVYVEVCGSGDPDYRFREKVYNDNVCRVIFVHHYKESEIWKSFLVQRILDINGKRIRETAKSLKIAKEMGIEFNDKI
jgi:hypothetical protein